MGATEILADLEAKELIVCAQKVREWQQQRELSDVALIKRYPDLGSDRTYHRILKADIGSEMDVEGQLENYRAVVAQIETLEGGDDTPAEELNDKISGTAAVRRAFTALIKQKGNARFVVVLGENGTGKTSTTRVLARSFGSRLLCIEADDTWNNKPNALSGAILSGLGVKHVPPGQTDRFGLVIDRLAETRRTLVIDEGHHMGPKHLNLLKTIINKTPTEVMVCAIPTLWRKLEGAAWEEARQLTGNRLAAKILLTVRESDVERIIRDRLPNLAGDALKQAVESIMARCVNPKLGNFAFLREVLNNLRREHGQESVSLAQWAVAVAAEEKLRGGGATR